MRVSSNTVARQSARLSRIHTTYVHTLIALRLVLPVNLSGCNIVRVNTGSP